MQIKALSERTNLTHQAIRYYEMIGLLPPPRRLPNGYREYDHTDVERLQLVAGARQLGFALADIGEIMALRDRREPPCRVVLNMLRQKADEISRCITELQQLETELQQLYALGATFSTDDVEGKECVCHLITQKA
jgi:DNA-binding transcriptional MerR regulator